MKILHLDSSVTGAASVSRELGRAAAEKVKKLYPEAEYTYRDLVKNTLRHYTALQRQGADESTLSTEQRQELQTGEEILQEFLSSDLLLIGAPMYNFGIPSQLKAWVDLNCVAGKTFRYGANGPEGLCGGKRVIVLSARGGKYGPGSPFEPFDHQERYLRDVFTFLGVKDITVITAEGVAMGPEAKDAAIAKAKGEIEALQ